MDMDACILSFTVKFVKRPRPTKETDMTGLKLLKGLIKLKRVQGQAGRQGL